MMDGYFEYDPVDNTLLKPLGVFGSDETMMVKFCYECDFALTGTHTWPNGSTTYGRGCLWPVHRTMGTTSAPDIRITP